MNMADTVTHTHTVPKSPKRTKLPQFTTVEEAADSGVTRVCVVCGVEKPLASSFQVAYKHKGHLVFRTDCRPCTAWRLYKRNNPNASRDEKIREVLDTRKTIEDLLVTALEKFRAREDLEFTKIIRQVKSLRGRGSHKLAPSML